ncbi:lipoprotein Spr [Pedobacter africanus]|uniref:Cell wall-associated NlpC family hydrolase n=1 Tax=Pedobacter africanus TaxID=151894 RepID=A0ACC6KZS6_9SPHI|nr:C40 family peptidase [Pedobacter africanus]MDR6784767.1 cell wall-associated NlpC family hydrolase [Pedobacter africanus]
MKKYPIVFFLILFVAFAARSQTTMPVQYQELVKNLTKQGQAVNKPQKVESPNRLLDFARSMLGIRYRSASSSPSRGFDCSGFVNYVFSNFGFKVPRSSRDFATSGEAKKLEDAKIGDVIVFTGTNSRSRTPGHVGIIYSIDGDEVKFIHSSSGGRKGVTISSLDEGFYKKRFLKVISIL